MKSLIIIIVSILFFSCSNRKQIEKFENVLGQGNSKTLTLMVADFENGFLKNKYPNLSEEKAYEKLLIEMQESESFSWGKLPIFDKTRFEESKLKYEIYSYVDSAWIETGENPKEIIQYKDLKSDGTYHKRTSQSSYRFQDGKSKDSIIKNLYTWTDLNYQGKFWKALKEVSNNNTFVTDYLDIAYSGGPVQPEVLIDEMLSANLNYSDYFVKRIIITSISY